MEIRQLTTSYEREVFAKCLTQARASHGIGYRDRGGSCLGKIHLNFASLYAFFEEEGAPVDQMRAGFRLHDLATLPQSISKPDMSHLPSEAVLEGGELWSLSSGAGRLASRAAGAIVGMLQARAVVIQAVVQPVDLRPYYAQLNFWNVGQPIEWPYAETMDGEKLIVQPMLLEGEPLEDWIRKGFDMLFGSRDDRRVRFQPSSLLLPEACKNDAGHTTSASARGEANGAAAS